MKTGRNPSNLIITVCAIFGFLVFGTLIAACTLPLVVTVMTAMLMRQRSGTWTPAGMATAIRTLPSGREEEKGRESRLPQLNGGSGDGEMPSCRSAGFVCLHSKRKIADCVPKQEHGNERNTT